MIYVVYEHIPGFRARIGPVLAAAFAGGSADGGRTDTLLGAVVAGLASVLFVPLYSSRFIPEHDGKVWSGGSCWADLPIHMHMAESFLNGRNQDVSWGGMHSPVFAGEPMAYPFLPDFHAAVLVRLGTTLRWGMMLPGLLLAVSLMVFLFTFSVRLTRSRLGGLLAILIAVGAGGMGGINLSMRDGFSSALNQDTAQNDVAGDGKIMWFAFIPHVLLPQRGATFAYPMVLLVLTLVWVATDMRKEAALVHSERRTMLLLAGAFAGSLPLIQAHSFIGLACIIGVIFLLDAHKWVADPRLLVSWGWAGVVAVGIGYPQMGLFKHQVESGHGGHFLNIQWWFKNHDFGRQGGLSGFFNFWWMSLGPALPLFVLTVALQLWELYLAHRLKSPVQERSPAGWTEFYQAAVTHEPFAPLPSASSAASAASATALRAYLANTGGETDLTDLDGGAAGGAGGAGGGAQRGRRGAGGKASPDTTPASASANSSSGGNNSNVKQRRNVSSASLSSRTPSTARSGAGSGSGSHPASPAPAFDAASATAPLAPPSPQLPQPLELRIESLEMEYSLPSATGEAGTGQRFKLELPGAATQKVLLSSYGGSGGGAAAGGSSTPLIAAPASATAGAGGGRGGRSSKGAAASASASASASATAGTEGDESKGDDASDDGRHDDEPPEGARVATAFATGGANGSSSSSSAADGSGVVMYRDPAATTYFSEHLWAVAKATALNDFNINVDVLLDPASYRWEVADRLVFHLNALSLTGRGLDALKFSLGAFAVFLLGNAINFQPWDRDNCKLFYIWVFVNASFVGALLASPVEYLLSLGPGLVRVASLSALRETDAYPEALYVACDGRAVGVAAMAAALATAAGAPASAVAAAATGVRVGLPKALYPDGVREKGGSVDSLKRRGGAAARTLAQAGALAAIPTLVVLVLTGFMMLYREFGLYHVLLDEDQLAVRGGRLVGGEGGGGSHLSPLLTFARPPPLPPSPPPLCRSARGSGPTLRPRPSWSTATFTSPRLGAWPAGPPSSPTTAGCGATATTTTTGTATATSSSRTASRTRTPTPTRRRASELGSRR
jgi:hypothetical protein